MIGLIGETAVILSVAAGAQSSSGFAGSRGWARPGWWG